jgi:hypothetical protein
MTNGISLGANFDRHWGGTGFDSFQVGLRSVNDKLVAEHLDVADAPGAVSPAASATGWSLISSRVPAPRFCNSMIASRPVRRRHRYGRVAVLGDGGAGIEYSRRQHRPASREAIWVDELDTSTVAWRAKGHVVVPAVLRAAPLRRNNPQPLADIPDQPAPSRFYFGFGRESISFSATGAAGEAHTPGQCLGPRACSIMASRSARANLPNLAIELTIDGGKPIKVDDHYAIGEYAQAAFTPMIRYRWPLCRGRWVPYVQAGGGLLYAEFNDAKPQSVFFPGFDTKGFYPVLRGGLGCEYFITRNFSLAAEANYQYTWDHEISLPDRPTVRGDFSTFQALLMFRVYLFDL